MNKKFMTAYQLQNERKSAHFYIKLNLDFYHAYLLNSNIPQNSISGL